MSISVVSASKFNYHISQYERWQNLPWDANVPWQSGALENDFTLLKCYQVHLISSAFYYFVTAYKEMILGVMYASADSRRCHARLCNRHGRKQKWTFTHNIYIYIIISWINTLTKLINCMPYYYYSSLYTLIALKWEMKDVYFYSFLNKYKRITCQHFTKLDLFLFPLKGQNKHFESLMKPFKETLWWPASYLIQDRNWKIIYYTSYFYCL